MCAVDENHVIIFGGAESTDEGLNARGDVWLLSLMDGTWELLVPDEAGPPPRNGAALFPLESDHGSTREYLLAGGWAPFRQTWDDCFVLRVERE
jgi:hypothetical protein